MKPLTEEEMWDIIDGIATPEVVVQHEALLKADITYKTTFDQLLRLQTQLLQLDLEEPSMRFTQNVMDKVTPSVKLTRQPDKVVRLFLISMGILASVFIIGIFVLGTKANGNPMTGFWQNIALNDNVLSNLSNPTLLSIFLIINALLIFKVIDKWVLKTFLNKR